MALPNPDDRTGARRTNVLVMIELDSDDTRSEEEQISDALVRELEGKTFYPAGMRTATVIHSASVREVETVQRGHRR